MKPPTTPLVIGILADLTRGKAELLAENARLAAPTASSCVDKLSGRRTKKADRLLLVLLARMVRTWKQALFLVQPETLLRWHRELFRVFWKHTSKVHIEKAEALARDDCLIKEMAANNRLFGAERIRGELLKLDIRVSKADHSEVYETSSRQFTPVDRPGKRSCAIMQQRCRG